MRIRDLVKREISNRKPRKLNGLGNVSERDFSLFFLYAYVLPIGGHSAATLCAIVPYPYYILILLIPPVFSVQQTEEPQHFTVFYPTKIANVL